MNLINKYFQITRKHELYIFNHLICADGLILSIQASRYHYCEPRNNKGPYTSVEIGFPNKVCPELLEYAEDINKPIDTVYSYVPIEIVEKIIKDHGGLIGFEQKE